MIASPPVGGRGLINLSVSVTYQIGEDPAVATIRVLIIDDHQVFAQALGVRLSTEPDIEILSVVTSEAELLRAMAETRPDLIVMDVHLDRASGIDLTARIHSQQCPPAVVVLTAQSDTATAIAAVQAGACGFVAKDSSTDDLTAAIRAAAKGEAWISPSLLSGVLKGLKESSAERSDAERLLGLLSPREREVLLLMMSGLDRAAIAASLYRSTNTVRTHTQKILAKLGAHSSVEAVAIALRAGLRPDAPAQPANIASHQCGGGHAGRPVTPASGTWRSQIRHHV